MSPEGHEQIGRFRSELGSTYLSGIFRTPDQLASQVAAAIARQGINRKMLDRRLEMELISDSMAAFARGASTDASAIGPIRHEVTEASAGTVHAFRIDLGPGEPWWSTRLFLLAVLAETLTGVRQFVFAHADGSFAGMASPIAVRERLSAAFPELAGVDAEIRLGAVSLDVGREFDRVLNVWRRRIQVEEPDLKVGVRMPLLTEWLGERLVTRCIRIEPEPGLTMTQVQQIVESLLPDVPVERIPAPPGSPAAVPGIVGVRLMVVDRDAFALELARQWVEASLARTTIL
jgi:hypothetical protein